MEYQYLKILIGKIYIIAKRRSIIIINLFSGFILIFKSSKKPIKNGVTYKNIII